MTEPTRKIGAITIGQAPRDDIMTVMTPHLPERLEVLQHGALDDLDGTAIAALRPDLSKEREEGDKAQHSGSSIEYDVLVSRMRDGSEAMMTHGGVVPLMQQKVDALEAADAELIVLLCGGDFPELHSNRIILHPGKLLRGAVESVAHGARLGIVMPSDVQVNAASEMPRYDGVPTRCSSPTVHPTCRKPILMTSGSGSAQISRSTRWTWCFSTAWV